MTKWCDDGWRFEGFWHPEDNKGFTQLPNELFEVLHRMSEAELKVVLYVLRHTWGYQTPNGVYDEEKKITTDEFMYGRKRKDGTRIDNGTGLSDWGVRDGLDRAEKHGFIYCLVDDHDRGRIRKEYGIRTRKDSTKPMCE